MASPTQRTLKLLRAAGLEPWKVERWIAPAKKRVDLFGLYDYVALWQPGTFCSTYTIGVQSTGTDHSGHVRKMQEPEQDRLLRMTCHAGWIPILISWRKTKPRGQRLKYRPRIELMIPPSLMRSELGDHGKELVQLLEEVTT